jgi:RND family efflux transporter MFP subunit
MKPKSILFIIPALALMAACSEPAEEAATERALPVTVATVRLGKVEVLERSVGRIEAATAPTVSTEVAGRIVELAVDAGNRVEAGALLARIDDTNYRNGVQRLEALHTQQGRTVERLRRLRAEESVSQSQLDEAQAQYAALAAQLRDARTALQRTRVMSPVAGRVQQRFASVGDFRGVGDPLFRVSTDDHLRVVLPFPERLSAQLTVGLAVRLASPLDGSEVTASVTEMRPMVGATSRALEVIVELDNPGGWRPGGSVSAAVVVAVRDDRTIAPAQAVVQRPSGQVVYVVDGDRVRERRVTLGIRLNGEIEVASGLQAGDRVAVDGAGFLTDGALVTVRETTR